MSANQSQLKSIAAMKPSSLAPALLAATLFLVPILPAQDSAADEMNTSAESAESSARRQAEILKRFDKNADGKLDEDEKTAAKEYNRENADERGNKARKELGKRAITRFDKDGDGKLNEAERAEAVKAAEKNPRALKRFDKDSDGKLSETEKSAALEAMTKEREKAAGKSK
jgi:Ca2+-binding EF-hand superfamily protein